MDYYRDFDYEYIFQKSTRMVLKAFPKKRFSYPDLPQTVIIKIFISENEPSEIQIHQELSESSPYVLKILDHWRIENHHFLCMEYCTSGDLHQRLIAQNGIPERWEIILQNCYQLTLTVDFMHSKQLAHRDIKPLNVYITDQGEYKLADFGEAKRIVNEEDYHTIRGTPYYMSPETFNRLRTKEEGKINPYRDDLWGLARTFIEITLGKLYPQISNFNYDDLQSEIYQEFSKIGYPTEFYQFK